MLDATLLSISNRILPLSLGVKPQALKLRFVSVEIQGTFVKPQMFLQEAVMRIQNQFQVLEESLSSHTPFHREFIGELGSLIFFPVFASKGKIIDGILRRVMGPEKDLKLDETPSGIPDHWHIKPMSTQCPNCGNTLKGEPESVLLFCVICQTAWNPSSGSWVAGKFETVPGKRGCSVYLPFWRMRVAVEGVTLNSYADLARAANLPKMILSAWETQEVYFWIPAFKTYPELFLRLSKQMTLFQSAEKTEGELPNGTLHPVTFSEENAGASLKIHLAHLLTRKKDYFPKLQEITIRSVESTLVFLPFDSVGSELVHPQLQIGLQRKTLSL
jgi:hypothetical protein